LLDITDESTIVVHEVITRKDGDRSIPISPREVLESQHQPGPSVTVARLDDDVVAGQTAQLIDSKPLVVTVDDG
jgi:hypothetical protein